MAMGRRKGDSDSIAYLIVIPPADVRRISRPGAARKTCWSWSVWGIRVQRVHAVLRPWRVCRTTCPDTTRCDQRKPISRK
jgi:hypothetical protein